MQSDIPVRVVDTAEYMDMICGLLAEGRTVPLLITGSSMTPFLVHGRDTIRLAPITEEPEKGDMILYRRRTGQYVMHRICRVRFAAAGSASDGESCVGGDKASAGKRKSGTPQYYFVGDAQTEVEGPIYRRQLLGIVVGVQRKGVNLEEGDFWWEFFRRVWLNIIPARRFVMRIYSVLMRKGKGQEEQPE